MARKRERIFAGFFALLFLATASVGALYAVWQASQGSNQTSSAQTNQTTPAQTPTKEEKLQSFTPTTTPQAQLQVIDTKPGTGQEVKAGNTVTADYTGAVMSDGVVFDASSKHGGPQTFPLSQVIAGWSQGIPGMKVGGTRRLLIPASLAYGANPPQGSGIPANADLVFDVTLHAISK